MGWGSERLLIRAVKSSLPYVYRCTYCYKQHMTNRVLMLY